METLINQPAPAGLNEIEKKALLFYLTHVGTKSAKHYYQLSKFYIQTGELEKAKESLQTAIHIDPNYTPAYLQLGFVDVWEQNWEEATKSFFYVLQIDPCQPIALLGLTKVALFWTDQERDRAICIANLAQHCPSENPDELLYLGILQTRLHLWTEAEETLRKCIEVKPTYQDAYLQLANLYVFQEKYEQAKEIYFLYPMNLEAEKGLARIANYEGKYKESEALYCRVLNQKPNDMVARRGLAQVLASQLKYTQAKKQYSILLNLPPPSEGIPPRKNEANWRQFMGVKEHTNVGLSEEMSYTDAKENDPTLRVPVVKDYYFLSRFTLFAPLLDRWRLDARQLYFHQRENNIFAPSVNYSAYVGGGELLSHYYFAKDWKWDLIAKVVHAWGLQQANFPFRSSTLFEPGTILQYNGDWNLLVIDGHVEDQIIKNFSRTISQLLRIDVYRGGYGLHPPVYLHPSFEIWFGRNFYHDSLHNWKSYQNAKASIDLGTRNLTVSYLFERGAFKALSQNYFSYRRQIQHTLNVTFTQNLYSTLQFEALWDHIWQSNHKVVMPIGTFIFVANNYYLVGNRFTARIKYRWRDHLRAELGGHYLRISIPYRDWNLQGSIHWLF